MHLVGGGLPAARKNGLLSLRREHDWIIISHLRMSVARRKTAEELLIDDELCFDGPPKEPDGDFFGEPPKDYIYGALPGNVKHPALVALEQVLEGKGCKGGKIRILLPYSRSSVCKVEGLKGAIRAILPEPVVSSCMMFVYITILAIFDSKSFVRSFFSMERRYQLV